MCVLNSSVCVRVCYHVLGVGVDTGWGEEGRPAIPPKPNNLVGGEC